MSFVHQHFYHVARLVYISVSWLGCTVATESSDAAASQRLRHHDSGVVPPAGATPYCPAAPSHVCLQPIFGRMPGRRPLSMAPAVATHFRHCDVLTLNSSAARVLPNGSARSRSRPRRAACWPSPGRQWPAHQKPHRRPSDSVRRSLPLRCGSRHRLLGVGPQAHSWPGVLWLVVVGQRSVPSVCAVRIHGRGLSRQYVPGHFRRGASSTQQGAGNGAVHANLVMRL